MKKIIYACAFSICALFATAQTPQKFNYQAVARNAQGGLLLNQNVKIKASILNGSPNGTSQYSETHTVTTHAQTGVFTLAIGGGVASNGNFATISWASGEKYLKIEMDPTGGNNFSLVGTSQLLSVPYALHAESTTNSTDKIAIIEYKNDGNEGCTITTAGQWHKRCLNFQSVNNIPASLTFNDANDVLVLQPGKYLVRAFGVANYCGGNVLRIRNTLTDVDEIYGSPGFSRPDDVDGENSYSQLEGILTVTAVNAQYVLEHWIQSNPTAGGSAVNKIYGDWPEWTNNVNAVWTRIVIQKIN